MSKIYGLYGGQHDASAVYIENGDIKFCIEEERINRIKSGNNYFSVPKESLETIENLIGVTVNEVDHLVFAEMTPGKFISENITRDYETYDHHDCHMAGAYYTSGMSGKVMTITMDGGGVNNAMSVHLCEDGNSTRVHKDIRHTSGQISQVWGYILSGIKGVTPNGEFVWKMCKDEGKLMGMAPDGHFDERIYMFLKQIISYKNLQFYPSDTIGGARFLGEIMRRNGWFDTDEKIAVFAHNLQLVTEELVLEFFNDLHQMYPQYTQLALAGGLFANVKLNQKINQLDWVDEVYIFPAMSDAGLSLGAAILKCRELGDGFDIPIELTDVHFGIPYSDDEVFEMSKEWGVSRKPYDPKEMGNELNDGKIIGWFQGGFEYGPRALGARSILVRPTDYDTHKELNERLHRYDTMPFAPMVMEEYFNDIFLESKSKYTAEFMTMCYDTKDEWIDKIPAVIQKSDKTARPQIVSGYKLPKMWELMDAYRSVSDIPVLLNTSFNAHNEPIINTPNNAFKHLTDGVIDKLIIGDYVYEC